MKWGKQYFNKRYFASWNKADNTESRTGWMQPVSPSLPMTHLRHLFLLFFLIFSGRVAPAFVSAVEVKQKGTVDHVQ